MYLKIHNHYWFVSEKSFNAATHTKKKKVGKINDSDYGEQT